MSNPWQDQADAFFRELQQTRRELDAARDANGRLTAELVQTQLAELRARRDLQDAQQRIEALREIVDNYSEAQDRLIKALIDANRLTDQYEAHLTRLNGREP